jgi:hypothetical protein
MQQDRVKNWKKKRKKGYKPRIFNEKEVGCKPVAKDMDKINHIYFKSKTHFLHSMRQKENEDLDQFEQDEKKRIWKEFRQKIKYYCH